jgi:methylsterol monooxygenase/4-alpha-methyl-delta7-sterol-4alpha-methyl oxidase
MKFFDQHSRLIPLISIMCFITFSKFINSSYLNYIYPKINSYKQLHLYFVTITTLPWTIIINLIFWLCYKYENDFIRSYKLTNVEWVWNENPEKWKVLFPKVLKRYLFNYSLLGSPIVQASLYLITPNYEPSESPSIITMILQISFCILCEDFFFYWSHRLLHQPLLYKLIHKTHHEFYNSISIACIYTHPVEFVIGNMFPLLAGPLIFKSSMHIITFVIWINIRMISTHDGHSGYDFPFSVIKLLPFQTSGGYHIHHHLKNIGNYASSMRIWDTIFGTNVEFLNEVTELQKEKIN